MTDKIQKLIEYIDPTKLPWDYQELIEIVGVDKTLEIAARCGGTYVYLEKLENILMPAVREYVLAKTKSYSDEDGINIRKIARDLNVSQDTIYGILRDKKKKEDDKPGWKQEPLL